MIGASKIKNSLFAWLCALVVMLSLSGNCVGENFSYEWNESGKIKSSTTESTKENGFAYWYDASDYANAPKRTVDNPVDLTDFRKDHILNRHGPGRGKSGKTEFPDDWSDEKVLHEISDVATDPASTVTPGRWGADRITGTRDGVDITVDLYPSNSKHAGKISTGYPTNTPVNP